MRLYPRTSASSRRQALKDNAMAHRILDRAGKGQEVRSDVLDWALAQTGDLATVSTEEATEAPHCLQRQADQFEAMDDMGAWAQTHPIVVGEVAE